jgi:hypothetical protein
MRLWMVTESNNRIRLESGFIYIYFLTNCEESFESYDLLLLHWMQCPTLKDDECMHVLLLSHIAMVFFP